MKVLIVKTSSLGDILHCFEAITYLKSIHPTCEIDWVVENEGKEVVALLPYVNKILVWNRDKKKDTFFYSLKKIYYLIRLIRLEKYDYVLDLQGNSKSGLFTLFSKGTKKVGFDYDSLPEKLNYLATNTKIVVDKKLNKRLFYLTFVQKVFSQKTIEIPLDLGVIFSKTSLPRNLDKILIKEEKKVMICPFSKMKNKEMDFDYISQIIQKNEKIHFFILCGNHYEAKKAEKIKKSFSNQVEILQNLSIKTLLCFMNHMDSILASDSFCLHLASLTKAKTYAFFGPTAASIFEPIKKEHVSFQGKCPYLEQFSHKCSKIKTCKSKACMKDFDFFLQL
jgi:heptosyltransferase-1